MTRKTSIHVQHPWGHSRNSFTIERIGHLTHDQCADLVQEELNARAETIHAAMLDASISDVWKHYTVTITHTTVVDLSAAYDWHRNLPPAQ